MAGISRTDVRFYTMGDSRYFLGAVALVNSLRIVGHHEPITFLDLGLTPAQRLMLEGECDVIDLDRDTRTHPFTLQPYPSVVDASGVCVIVDSDVILTQRLDALVDAATAGKISAFVDRPERCLDEWQQVFELDAPLHHGLPYVNSGLVVFHADLQRRFIDRWWSLCRGLRVEFPPSPDSPTGYADQDVLNALLMSEYVDDRVALEQPSMALGWDRLTATTVDDLDRLACSRDGVPVAALHSVARPKPWTDDARYMLRTNSYVTCLRRCLAGPDLTMALPDELLPSWLRPGKRSARTMRALQSYFRMRQRAYRARSVVFGEPVVDPATQYYAPPEAAPTPSLVR